MMMLGACSDKISTEIDPNPEPNPEPKPDVEEVVALKKIPFTKGLNLSDWFNVSEAYWFNPDTYTEKDFDQLKSLGIDVVRLPINFPIFMGQAPSYTFNQKMLTALDKAVEWAAARGIYVILDQHSYYGSRVFPEGYGEELDDKVRRVLRLMFRTSMNRQHGFGSRNSAEHSADALAIQQEGIVLLKNKGAVLPIDRERYKRILVVGENADFSLTRYGGSSGVKARYEIMPIDAIREMVGKNCVVEYQKGYTSDWPRNPQVEDSLMVEAIKAAKDAELIVFIGGHNKHPGQDTESYDRSSSNAPFRQGELLSELVKNKVPLILVTMGADLFDMPYIERFPAMLHTWYGGSESGTALAQVLFGEVNPSGKLPVTFYRKASDCGAFVMGEYPGDGEDVHYDEDIFVGYRYVEKYGVKPQFSFGHGLSYTNFEYGKASLSRNIIAQDDSIEVKVPITNIGKRSGKEIVELYVRDEKSTVFRPEKELKGFDKIELAPGETKEARFIISVRDLSFYDERQGCWIAEPGKFEALIGSSSDNIKAKAVFELQ